MTLRDDWLAGPAFPVIVEIVEGEGMSASERVGRGTRVGVWAAADRVAPWLAGGCLGCAALVVAAVAASAG